MLNAWSMLHFFVLGMDRKLEIIREVTGASRVANLRREVVVEFTGDPSNRTSYKSTSKFIYDGKAHDEHEYEGLSEEIYEIIEVIVRALDRIDEYQFSHGRIRLRSRDSEPQPSNPGVRSFSRDHFDALRELDALLRELEEHFRGINDPNRISNDLLYVKAASQSLSSFISSYSNEDNVEIPTDLPLSLLHRIQRIRLPQAESLAGVIQKIADAISKLFL